MIVVNDLILKEPLFYNISTFELQELSGLTTSSKKAQPVQLPPPKALTPE